MTVSAAGAQAHSLGESLTSYVVEAATSRLSNQITFLDRIGTFCEQTANVATLVQDTPC